MINPIPADQSSRLLHPFATPGEQLTMPGEEPLDLEPFRHTDVEKESSTGHRMSPPADAGPHTPRKKGFTSKLAAALHLPGAGKTDITHEPQRVSVQQVMETAPLHMATQPETPVSQQYAARPQQQYELHRTSPQGPETLPEHQKYPPTMDRSVESLMMPVEDLAPLIHVQADSSEVNEKTTQPQAESEHFLPQDAQRESEPVVAPGALNAPLLLPEEEQHTDTGPVKEGYRRVELGSIFTGLSEGASTVSNASTAATAGTTTSESDSVPASAAAPPVEKWPPSSPPVTPTRRSPELEEIPESASLEFEAIKNEGEEGVGSTLPGDEMEGPQQEVGQLLEAPPPAETIVGEAAHASAQAPASETKQEEGRERVPKELDSIPALELTESSRDASELIRAPPPTPQPSLEDYSQYSPTHSEESGMPVPAPSSYTAEKTGEAKGAKPSEKLEPSPISEAPLGRPSEPLVLPFMEVPDDLSPGELPVSDRRPNVQWAIIELYNRPLARAALLIGVFVAIRMAWAAAPAAVQDFGPALAVSGALAVAATIAATVFARAPPLIPVPITETEMRSLNEDSSAAPAPGSEMPGISEPVSSESTEDLRHQHTGAADFLHGVEHAAEGAYERLMEAIDPGKEMVGDVIQEEEEEGGEGGAAVRAAPAVIGTKKGALSDINEEPVGGIARMQRAAVEGGYTSDSDAPGPVIKGVHVQGRTAGGEAVAAGTAGN